MATFHAKNARVFIGEVEISGLVQSLSIRASVGEIATVELRLLAMPLVDVDGNIRIPLREGDGAAKPGETPARGILIRA